MLQLKKNALVTNMAQGQVDIRQMEIDWYCENYGVMTGQAAMLAGFAFSYLTAEIPEGDNAPHIVLEFCYFFLVCLSIGLELAVIIISSYLSVWGPSLALRGSNGTADLHKACDCLRDYQKLVFRCFLVGWCTYFVASILQVWIYYSKQVAGIVTFPLGGFVLAIVWYSYDLTAKLALPEDRIVIGKIEHFQAYEFIGDIDKGIQTGQTETCPIHREALASFTPSLASQRR
eukprot:TRINITY_DN52496_c0_g1_i1.p1 TRINITY_DN52496_c0_g1~~TRINITY_DN52496_c0_g1_i1.p1  ORF type:complete len:231 (-),score=15.45 TRINITY_DN52496_c0_g1_i1:104-796(-)